MDKEIKKLLENVRHELTYLTGLSAFDSECPEKSWELDYRNTIKEIDIVFNRFYDTNIRS